MNSYKVLSSNVDFYLFETSNNNIKGTRTKKDIIDGKSLLKYKKTKKIEDIRFGYFKYSKYENCSEECSEKLAYEIAKVLKLKVARVELAKDNNGVIGIISFLFTSEKIRHTDAKDFLNSSKEDRKITYTIPNIKRFLDTYSENAFNDFIGIMVFDALIGETDRHEENWGLLKIDNMYELSPIYDSGCNLLRECKDLNILNKKIGSEDKFTSYINKSLTYIYNENEKQFTHFELIKYLYELYPSIVTEHINKLYNLTDKKIYNIINKLPYGIIEKIHCEYIYKYIIRRKNILLEIIKGEKV